MHHPMSDQLEKPGINIPQLYIVCRQLFDILCNILHFLNELSGAHFLKQPRVGTSEVAINATAGKIDRPVKQGDIMLSVSRMN